MEIPVPRSIVSSDKFTKNQKNVFVLFLITSFMYNSIYSIVGPLYPPEATAKGLTPSEYGLLMAINAGSITISTLCLAMMEQAGQKMCLLISIILSGSGAILMGLLHFFNNWQFIVLSTIAFCVAGVSGALFLSSTYILCLSVFPKTTAIGIGAIEGGLLMGACLGPILCEIIFTYVGYTATYTLFGLVQFGIGFVVASNLPPVSPPCDEVQTCNNNWREYIKISKPSVILFAITILTMQLSMDFLTPILEPSLRPYGLSRIGVGLTFFSLGAPQLLGILWGILLDKVKRPELFLVGGIVLIIAGTLILHKSIEWNYGGIIAGLILYGLGLGIMDVSSIFNFQLEVKRSHQSNAISFNFIGVVYAFMTGVGGLLAPSISGSLFDYYGFGNAMLFIVITHTTVGMLTICHMLCNKCEVRAIVLKQPVSGDYEQID